MRIQIKVWLVALGLFILPVSGYCQQIEEKLIVRDAGDSLFARAFRSAFDSAGDYYFETMLRRQGDKFALATGKKKYNPVFKTPSIALTHYQAVLADAFFSDSTHKKIYFKNRAGTHIYGPRAGRIRELLEFGKENIVMELCVGAKSYLYINDTLVNVADSAKQHWLCTFSNNNNVLYSICKNGCYRLYLNHKLIDTSAAAFIDIAVNDNKFCTYVKPVNGKFMIYAGQRVFGPFMAVDNGDLWNNNAYYFRGCADSECFVLVNDNLVQGIPEAHTIIEDPVAGTTSYRSDEQITVEPYDAKNFIFSYNANNDDGTFLNVNGKVKRFNYSMTGFVFSDASGNYAFYGYRADSFGVEQIFKNINGVEKKMPSFKKTPYYTHTLSLDPDGESNYYLETADSVYLYHNDRLLCSPAERKKFFAWDASVLPQAHPEALQMFQGLNIGTNSYVIYNNTISRPLPLIYPAYEPMEQVRRGSIVAGEINGNGYYIIVNTAPGKYLLVINNKVYKELEGIDSISGEQSYLDAGQLIFYGTKGNSFYQFRVRF